MIHPRRIQLKRTKGWKMPPNTVKVDRSTRWGNPHRVRPGYTAADAVSDFRIDVNSDCGLVMDIKEWLAGKDLACWCALDQPCHADALLEIANDLTAVIQVGTPAKTNLADEAQQKECP